MPDGSATRWPTCPRIVAPVRGRAWNEIETASGSWVRGQLILMGAIGLGTGVAYTLLGVPGALLLGSSRQSPRRSRSSGPLLGAIPAILVAATISPELAFIVAGHLRRPAARRGQRPRPDGHAQRDRDLAVPHARQPARSAAPPVGLVGALIAVPIAAAIEIVLSRLQARETPVVQDPAAIEALDDAEADDGTEGTIAGKAAAPVRRTRGPDRVSRARRPRSSAGSAMPSSGSRRLHRRQGRAACPGGGGDGREIDDARRIRGLEAVAGRTRRTVVDVAGGHDLDIVLPLDREATRGHEPPVRARRTSRSV